MMQMTTAEAVQYVLDTKHITKYRLAMRMLSSPSSVDQWLSGTKMGATNRKAFKQTFNVEIQD